MIRLNAPDASPLEHGTVRAVLAHVNLTPRTCSDELAQSLRLFYPLDKELALRVRSGTSSLTDSATANEQIRFFQQRRLLRSYIKIAEHLANRLGDINIEIGNHANIDASSHDFFAVAASVCGWKVSFRTEAISAHPSESIESLWAPEETTILAILNSARESENVDPVINAAFEYVSVGDGRTAEAIGRHLVEMEQSPRIWNLLALASSMQNKSEQAEIFYKKWGNSIDKLDQVRALYGRAMLYARHHQPALRSIAESGALLDEAYHIIQNLPADVREDDSVVFEEVFNRNGAALVYFRTGNVDEALRIMHWGIARLTQTTEKVAIHRSVLMYNLAQCYRQMGNIEQAINTYEALLRVDPHMAEYHLEAAKCYAQSGDYQQAIECCHNAIRLDDTLASAWSLQGVYLNRTSQYLEAAESFHEASRLAPRQIRHALDEAYSLILAGQIDESFNLLNKITPINTADLERWGSLYAEGHLKNGDANKATEALTHALNLHPSSRVLKENLNRVTDHAAN